MTTSVWRFLWTLYHTVGEGMPDKFNFEMQDAKTLVLAARKTLKRKGPNPLPTMPDEIDTQTVSTFSIVQDDEQQVRAIANHAM